MRFAPDDADVAAVKALLTQAGMTNITVGAANAYVSATATVGQLRSTFSISQDTYTFGTMTLRANREAPTIPGSLAGKIINIEGLDDSTFLKRPVSPLGHAGRAEGARRHQRRSEPARGRTSRPSRRLPSPPTCRPATATPISAICRRC